MLGLVKKLKTALLRSMVWLIYYSGALGLFKDFINRFQLIRRVDNTRSWPVLLRVNVRNVQILTYHRVNDEADPFFPGVPIRVFTEQMDYLAHSYNTAPTRRLRTFPTRQDRVAHRNTPRARTLRVE